MRLANHAHPTPTHPSAVFFSLLAGSEPNIFDLFAIPPNFAPAPGHARLVHLAEARGKALGLEPACLSLKAGAYDWAG